MIWLHFYFNTYESGGTRFYVKTAPHSILISLPTGLILLLISLKVRWEIPFRYEMRIWRDYGTYTLVLGLYDQSVDRPRMVVIQTTKSDSVEIQLGSYDTFILVESTHSITFFCTLRDECIVRKKKVTYNSNINFTETHIRTY